MFKYTYVLLKGVSNWPNVQVALLVLWAAISYFTILRNFIYIHTQNVHTLSKGTPAHEVQMANVRQQRDN